MTKKDMSFPILAAQASTDFERTNTELKRQYIVSNIIMYNYIGTLIKESHGTFGTGYPFYILDRNLQGALPVIDEQIRYNDELVKFARESKFKEWRCARCISEERFDMPDLKTICKICPNMDDGLKPRKVINRLPDLDMWMVYDKPEFEAASQNLQKALEQHGFRTSDVDPVSTIEEIVAMAETLKSGEMPSTKLPIDTHLIDKATLYTLISAVPDKLDHCHSRGLTPFLSINPVSLRKKWQYDDNGYNFIHDFFSSFTEFNFDQDLQEILDETRKYVAKKYSLDTLYSFMYESGPDSAKRRFQGIDKGVFAQKIESWLQK